MAAPPDQQQAVALEDVVIVAQSNSAIETSGCSAMSVFSYRSAEPLFRGSPGPFLLPTRFDVKPAANSNFTRILTAAGDPAGGRAPSILALAGDIADRGSWRSDRRIRDVGTVSGPSIALLPDDDSFLLVQRERLADSTFTRDLRRFRLSEVGSDGVLGPDAGSVPLFDAGLDGLFISERGDVAYALMDQGFDLLQIDTSSMRTIKLPIVPPLGGPPPKPYGGPFSTAQRGAALTPDGRFIVRSGWYAATLDVFDTVQQGSWTVGGVRRGEIAFNHAMENYGLLAIRDDEGVSMYRFNPFAASEELGRLRLDRTSLRQAPVAWTGDGTHLIVGVSETNRAEFLVVAVRDGGTRLTPTRWLRSCAAPNGVQQPRGVLTANGLPAARITPTPGALPTPTQPPWPTTAAPATDLDNIVFVADAMGGVRDVNAVQMPGCGAVSVFDATSAAAVYRGAQHGASGRLAAKSDFSLVLATNAGRGRDLQFQPSIYLMEGDAADRGRWRSRGVALGADVVGSGGIAVLPDNDTLLVATAGGLGRESVYGDRPYGGPPYGVRRFRLAEISMGGAPLEWGRLGPEWGAFLTASPVFAILPTSDGGFAHLVTADAVVHTISVSSMTETTAAIQLPQILPSAGFDPDAPGKYLPWAFAAITGDGRYLLTNQAGKPALNIADLAQRSAQTVPLADVSSTGGIAVNRGPLHTGAIALHAGDTVVVYEFHPPSTLLERARRRVPWPECCFTHPRPAIAWTGSGARIAVAADIEDEGEFAIMDLAIDGRSLGSVRPMEACEAYHQRGLNVYLETWNSPSDILTSNNKPPPAVAWPSLMPLPTASPTRTVTPAQPTPAASATASGPPRVAFLPILGFGRPCQPGETRGALAVALLLDSSTSMGSQTRAGRTKLQAAAEAALAFVDALNLEKNDFAAVVAFNADATLRQPLTQDRAALAQALLAIPMSSGTAVHRGIEVAQAELLASAASRARSAIVLMTDGRLTPDLAGLAQTRADEAKARGITIVAVGLGEDVEAPVLQRLASGPQYYYYAPDAEDLAALYRTIAVALPCAGPAGDSRRSRHFDKRAFP